MTTISAALKAAPKAAAQARLWVMACLAFVFAALPLCAQEATEPKPNEEGIYEFPAEEVDPSSEIEGDAAPAAAEGATEEGAIGEDGTGDPEVPEDPAAGEPEAAEPGTGIEEELFGPTTDSRTEIQYGVSSARPLRGFRFGDLDIAFLLGTSMVVDDNIFLRDEGEPTGDPTSGEDDDVVLINVPGVRLDLGLGDHQIMAEYRMEIQTFLDHEEQNNINNFYDVQTRFNFGEVYFNVGDRLQVLTSPIDLAISNKVERLDHTSNVLAGMKHQRLTLEVGFQHQFLDFENRAFQHIDHQEDYITAFLAYQLNARWEVTLDYRYGERDYEENLLSDSNVNVVRGGFRGFITPKLEIVGNVGYESVNLESGSISGDENDYQGVSAFVAAKYRITPRTTLRGAYSRNTKYGSFSAYEIVNDVEVGASHQLTRDLRLGFNMWFADDDPSQGPRRQQVGVRTGADWEVRPWWHLSAEGVFRWQEADSTSGLFVVFPDGRMMGPPTTTDSLDYFNAQLLLSSLLVF